MDTLDQTSLPMDALLVYSTPGGTTNVAPIPFSDLTLEDDVVHFFGDIDGLPFGIPLTYFIQLTDVFGNQTASLPDTVYLYGSRVGIRASGVDALVSWTTSYPESVLARRQDLGLGDLWRVVGGTPTVQAAPSVAGTHFKKLEGDTTCQSPVKVGDIRIVECVGGFWEIAVYSLYQCLDGTYRISIPANSRSRTTVQCTSAVPSPFL